MTSKSNIPPLTKGDLADYGFARVRDLAFDAVLTLWRRRNEEGMKQSELAEILDRDPAWISRKLQGPGNWTMRTFGELIAALDGEVEITVHGIEDQPTERTNYDAYDDFPLDHLRPTSKSLYVPQNTYHVKNSQVAPSTTPTQL